MKIKIENVNVYIGKAPLGEEQDSPIPVRVVPTVGDVEINTSEEIPEHKINKIAQDIACAIKSQRADSASNHRVVPKE